MKLMANLKMPLINRCQFAGRITRDPEVKSSSTGDQYARAGFAVAQVKDKEATFLDLIAWGKQSEQLMELRKGAPVIVEGQLEVRRVDKDGVEHKYVSLRVWSLYSLEWPDDASAATPPPARNDAQRASAPPHPASSQEDDIPF